MLKFGFFDSINGDRKYNSRDIAQMFDGIIVDGIYAQIGNHFSVNPKKVMESLDDDMKVVVDTGQAWLSHVKVLNTTQLELVIGPAITETRYDAIIIEINEETRDGSIYVKENVKTHIDFIPVIPNDKTYTEFDLMSDQLTNTEFIHQYLLAVIKVERGINKITEANIASKIGFAIPNGIPYVTCPLDPFPADETLKQWVAQWTEFYEAANAEFEAAQSNRETVFNDTQIQRENTFNTFMTESINSYEALKLLITNWLNSTETDWNTWFTGVKAKWDNFQNAIDTAVSNHNESDTAHSDIRDLIEDLTTRLNALVDSDDTTLDQLSEIVAYIKSNRDLIDVITTSKVSVSDIVDNLNSSNTDKPLSANQGNVLKTLIETINTKVTTSYATKVSVEELKKSVSDGKELVADAITEKGVTTAADATFAMMAENISEITTGSDMVLQESKTVKSEYSVQTVFPDEGYDGLSKVVVDSLKLQSKTVNANDILTDDAILSIFVIPDSGYDGLGIVNVNNIHTQKKTVSPSTSAQIVVPDSGYDVLSQVTVNAMKLQSKIAAPSSSAQSIHPDSGYNGLSEVVVNSAPLQSKTVTPSASAQTIKPDSSYYGLSQVVVNAGGQPSSVTIAGNLGVYLHRGTGTNSGTTNKSFTTSINLPMDSDVAVVSGLSGYLSISTSNAGSYAGGARVTITGIYFDEASSVSMIADHMGVDLETAQQMYAAKNVLFEFEEDESEISKAQKISEAITRSKKSVVQDEKLVSGVRDTAISDLAEEGGQQQ